VSSGPTTDAVAADWLAGRIAAAAPSLELAGIIGDAIESGELVQGTRLPTIRELNAATGVGVRAIAEAWAQLRHRGLIETRRRGGSFVTAADAVDPHVSGPGVFGTLTLDLAKSSADVAFLPDLRQAIESGLQNRSLHSSVREFITPRLRERAREVWPFDAESFIACGSGAEAVLLAVLGVAGQTVAVDEPVNPGFLASLRNSGVQVFGVRADTDGPLPEALAAAVEAGATTYVFQASAPYSRGAATTSQRLVELTKVLADVAVAVVEEDSAGPLAGSSPPSFGAVLDGRVVRVQSFCKSFGVDLRTSLIGGARGAVESIQSKRSNGLAVTSRIMQDALAFLLGSPGTSDLMHTARVRYTQRRANLVSALAQRGVTATTGPDGQFVWVDVDDEVAAILQLAGEGITVGAGRECFVGPAPGSIRIATMRLPDEPDALDQIAETISATLRETAVNYYV
jgi:DNA-binding transcriptional MocR family regulator